MRIGSHTVTSVFHIPFEERSDRDGRNFGEMQGMTKCAEISNTTGAHIEMSSSSRDQSLTFLVTGKQVSSFSVNKWSYLQCRQMYGFI